MRPTLAIAATTIREAKAFRVYLAILPFAALAVFGVSYSQPSPEDAARYAREVLVVAALICTVPTLILFAAVAMREERLGRSLSVLFARPVRRVEYVIGRYLGFCAVAVLLLAAMCLLGTLIAMVSLPGDTLHVRPRYTADKVSSSVPAESREPGVFMLEDSTDYVTWTFDSLPKSGLSRGLVVIKPQIYGAVRASVSVERTFFGGSPATAGTEDEIIETELEDNRNTVIPVYGSGSRPEADRPCSLTLRMHKARGVVIRIDTGRDSMGRERHGLHWLGDAEMFPWSYGKTLAYHFINLAFVLAVCVIMVGFTSAPVAGTFALVVYLVGISVGGLASFLAQPSEAFLQAGPEHAHLAAGPLPGWFAVAATAVLHAVVAVFPDLSRYETTGVFVSGEGMPLFCLLRHFLLLLPYIVVAIGVAWGISARREAGQ
ncbi:MAG: hypothetical protein E3J72_22835 [Planctomycetota bacterium]|nr:MAG: hypothetical protein E3J72_22835 [Planctomycetota bacterium]